MQYHSIYPFAFFTYFEDLRSTDNVRPEWQLHRPQNSLAGHVDRSCTLSFLINQLNPHL